MTSFHTAFDSYKLFSVYFEVSFCNRVNNITEIKLKDRGRDTCRDRPRPRIQYICTSMLQSNNNDSDDHVWLILLMRLLQPHLHHRARTRKVSKMGQWPKKTYYNRWTISPIVFSDWDEGRRGCEGRRLSEVESRGGHSLALWGNNDWSSTGFRDPSSSLCRFDCPSRSCAASRWLTRASVSYLLRKTVAEKNKATLLFNLRTILCKSFSYKSNISKNCNNCVCICESKKFELQLILYFNKTVDTMIPGNVWDI